MRASEAKLKALQVTDAVNPVILARETKLSSAIYDKILMAVDEGKLSCEFDYNEFFFKEIPNTTFNKTNTDLMKKILEKVLVKVKAQGYKILTPKDVPYFIISWDV